jgi:hypothetical protein
MDYVDGKVVLTEPSQRAIDKAKADLAIFNERQQAIYNRTKISEGDWVRMPDGSMSRVTVASWPDTIQIGGHSGSSVYIHESGRGSYSGGCGDSIERDRLVDTGEYEEAGCWIFSGNRSGAHRGVYSALKFKVFELINN